jgi:hypothetical protein
MPDDLTIDPASRHTLIRISEPVRPYASLAVPLFLTRRLRSPRSTTLGRSGSGRTDTCGYPLATAGRSTTHTGWRSR